MSSALTRYSLVTPNRPLATCLIAERRRSPFGSGLKRSGAPPPPPGAGLPPLPVTARDSGRWRPCRALAALACVGLAARPVHRGREGLVGLGRDRAVAHRAGGEAPDDLA